MNIQLVVLLFLSSFCYGQDSTVQKKVYLGSNQNYECYTQREGALFLSEYLNNNNSLDMVIFKAMTYNISRIKLDLPVLFEFDNMSSLVCDVREDKNRTKNINNVKFSILNRRYWNRKVITSYHEYMEGVEDSFDCQMKEKKFHDTLHWIKVNDKYIPQSKISDYISDHLTYVALLTKEDNGSTLICVHFQCERQDRTAHCKRYVLIEKHLILVSSYSNNKAYQLSWTLIGGIIGISAITILLAAMVWFWKYKSKMNSRVQYIEVQFSKTPSKRTTPVKKDEIIYSKVTGIIVPERNKELVNVT